MVVIKYILIFSTITVFTVIGNLYSKKYLSRLNELERIDSILNIFKAKIKFTCLTIQEIFEQIYLENKDNIGEIFKFASDYMNEQSSQAAWEKALENAKDKTNLNEEDIVTLKTLGKMLGNTDIAGQVSQIELTEQMLIGRIENAKIERQKKRKVI